MTQDDFTSIPKCPNCGKQTHTCNYKCVYCGFNYRDGVRAPSGQDHGPTKHYKGKRDWSLLPWDQAEEVVKALEIGEKKHGRYSWQQTAGKGGFHLRVQNALLRHVLAYVRGRQMDEESGLHHLAHAACNCFFLMWFDERGSK